MSQPLFVGQKLELFVEKLSFNGGRGVARAEGVVLFVEGAAPQEKVLAEVTKLHKRFAEARVLEVIEASSSRREAPCPVYSLCGGCNLQHVDYPTQIAQKLMILAEQLRHLSREHKFEIKELVASDNEFFYRNRVQFHLNNGRVGFFRRGSHEIVDTAKCYLVEDDINLQLTELRSTDLKKNRSSRLELRSANSSGADFFSQVNSSQNLKLQNEISKLVQSENPLELWDLYGGAGNFSLPIAKSNPGLKIVCVEGSSEAIEFGKRQTQELDLTQIDWVNSSVEEFLKNQSAQARVILIDPPRIGLTEVARKRLSRLLTQGSKLIYLSCNPSAFARDAAELMKTSRLSLRWVQAYDLFPQTDHIEMLSFFD